MEIERDGIDTMTLIGGCWEAFSIEYMAEMPFAVTAGNLGAFLCQPATYHAKRKVVVAVNSTWDGVKESRPSTSAIKFGRTLVQRRVASPASIYACLEVLVKLSSTCTLRALFTENAKLHQSHYVLVQG